MNWVEMVDFSVEVNNSTLVAIFIFDICSYLTLMADTLALIAISDALKFDWEAPPSALTELPNLSAIMSKY